MSKKEMIAAWVEALDKYTDARIKLATDPKLERDREMRALGWGGGEKYDKMLALVDEKRAEVINAMLVIVSGNTDSGEATLTLC